MSGDTFILVFNESLYYGERFDHSLINPNQLRSYGIPFWDNPFDPDHSLCIEVHDDHHIPLRSCGTKVTFRTRVPTSDELRTCEHVYMISAHPWNPSNVVMIQQATVQGGNTPSWKRDFASTNAFSQCCEYVDSTSDEARLDSVDPSFVGVTA